MHRYRLIGYNHDESSIKEVEDPSEAKTSLDRFNVTWLDCVGLSGTEIEKVGELFRFHRLAIEDCLGLSQRAKIDDYRTYYFLVAKAIESREALKPAQVNLFVGKNYLVSISEKFFSFMDDIANRISEKDPRILESGPDHLCYLIMDEIVDRYFPILDEIEREIDTVEEEIMNSFSKKTSDRIFRIRKDLILMRKVVWPMRDILMRFEKENLPHMSERTVIYFRDVYDHVIWVADMLENYRELTAGCLETYLTSVSNNLNEVVKTLTVITALVLVPAFIAGLYGMNFDPFPTAEHGPFFPLGLMSASIAVMLLYFRAKKWI